ncbi:MAG: hypothetical protein WBO55_15355 [Rhizobiaceae bacterium]
MNKSVTSAVFLVVLAATVMAAFSVYAAHAASSRSSNFDSRIENAFDTATACARQVWPAIDSSCLVSVSGSSVKAKVRNAG